jgi:hypothetical protein
MSTLEFFCQCVETNIPAWRRDGGKAHKTNARQFSTVQSWTSNEFVYLFTVPVVGLWEWDMEVICRLQWSYRDNWNARGEDWRDDGELVERYFRTDSPANLELVSKAVLFHQTEEMWKVKMFRVVMVVERTISNSSTRRNVKELLGKGEPQALYQRRCAPKGAMTTPEKRKFDLAWRKPK